MFRFITLDYILYVLFFLVLTAYFILFIIKHKVEDHIVLFILVIIVMVILLLYLVVRGIRNTDNIGLPLSPQFTFVPRDYSSLDMLPVNRYPFLGSHDAGTFVQQNTNINSPLKILIGLKNEWLYTQTLDFFQQYQHGVRFLDCRFQYFSSDTAITFRHGDGIALGEDVGGIFFPITDSRYESMDRFLANAVADQDLVILKITKEKSQTSDRPLYNNENMSLWTGTYFETNPTAGTTSIMANLALYLSKTHRTNNYLANTAFISSTSELNNRVSSFKASGKYILVVMDPFVTSNYVSDVVCQNAPINALDFANQCNTNTCINPNDSSWTTGTATSTGLFSYMTNVGNHFNRLQNTSSSLNMTQAMFQSYAGLSNLWMGLPLPFQDCTDGDITKLDTYAHVTYQIYKYLTANPTYLSNITIMDNIGQEMSPIVVNGIPISWTKMVAYQLKENYMNAIIARNPFLTQYGL